MISDVNRAKNELMNIGYYRLSAYMLPFQKKGGGHQFISNTNFDDILHYYYFDGKLRLHLLEAIERIEISIRAQLTDRFVEMYGAHGYLIRDNFQPSYHHDWLLKKVEDQIKSSTELFIKHYTNKYKNPSSPPFWMVTQLLTFKEIVMLMENIKDSNLANGIAEGLDIKDKILFSWARCISDLRNICAHHARVWNRVFGSKPKIPKKSPTKWLTQPTTPFSYVSLNGSEVIIDPHASLYYQIVISWYWLRKISPSSSWFHRLRELLTEYQIAPELLGFCGHYEKDIFWL